MIEYNKRNSRAWSIMGINPAIWGVAFAELMERKDDRAVFTADLQRYSGLNRIFSQYPDRAYNVGIAEQNMVGIAAGMAMEGIQTWMTTYAPFMSLRCADQFRHLMGNLNLDMKAIGSAAGLSAGLSGTSLLAINDIAFARSIPNIIVLSPADCTEAVKMVEAIANIKSPVYMRFCGATRIPVVYDEDYDYEIGKAITLRSGEQVAIIAMGTGIVSESLKAAKLLESKGINATVIDMHTIKPLDDFAIEKLLERHDLICTVEEHSVIGGLGGAVAECLSRKGCGIKQLFVGIQDTNYIAGSRPFMLKQCGLTADQIANQITNYIKE